jgi:peroxiredoxin
VKNSVQIFLAAMLALFSSNLFAGERVGDFALIDHLGAQHHMSWYDDQNAVVILPYANGATYAIASLTDLQAKYTDQGVVFFLMNPGTEADRKVVGADAAVKELALPVLMDDTQIISEALGFI